MKTKILVLFLTITCVQISFSRKHDAIQSPDGKISVTFGLSPRGEPSYTVAHSGTTILKSSKLGIQRSDGDFSTALALDSVSKASPVRDTYTLLHGKRLTCAYTATKRVVYLKNARSQRMEIIFQVSNDGVAFRYHFPETSDRPVKIFKEATSYHFDRSAKAFLQPCADARMGWCFASPSYEEYYSLDIPAGTNAPYQAGWVMPALFHFGKFWMSITETSVDTNYCGSRLSQFSPDGEYSVQFPQPQESKSGGPVLPESVLPWYTPWRVIAISDRLAGLMESTLETDLSRPAQYDASSWIRPGLASWSWVMLKDDSTVYSAQRTYIDFASSMNWRYCLIDALWDTQIGYDKLKDLAAYASTKNVKLLVWYNSAGDWNTVTITPRDKMLTPESRQKEFQKLQEIGISGVKIDFFGGDGQSMMKYYIDILTDANKYHLSVNFHGATFPRGWSRTYPNLVSMEAIRGEEYITFGQSNADQQPSHCAIIPFTRNLFDPMDFTPVNFSGIPHIKRKTTKGFELALSVLFTSGVQHIAETPWGMAAQKDFIRDYMRSLPETWEDVKFLDGYPGKFVVMARKTKGRWYIAGINGEQSERTVTLATPFISAGTTGAIITDDSQAGSELEKKATEFSKPITITMHGNGGFVITTNKEGMK